MRASYVVPLAVFSTLALFFIAESDAIKCYVCQDCAESFESSHIQNCSRNQDKCIKMTLMSGDIDRMCADKNRCDGRPKGRSKRSIEEQIEDCLPKRRTVRQLLGGDGGGGSSSSSANKNKNKKEKDKPKEDKPGTREAMEIHCCVGDGCNGAPHMISLPSTFLLFSFLLCTLFASLHLQPPYLRTV